MMFAVSIFVGAAIVIAAAAVNAGTSLHEHAHRVAAHFLFRIKSEEMRMYSFFAALTRRGKYYGTYEYTSHGLSKIGQYCGENLARAFVIVAGPVADTLISLVLYVSGYLLQAIYPYTSLALQTAGLVYFLSTFNHVKAALFSKKGDLYDFSVQIGVHPVITGFIFVSSFPLLIITLHIFL